MRQIKRTPPRVCNVMTNSKDYTTDPSGSSLAAQDALARGGARDAQSPVQAPNDLSKTSKNGGSS
jgi:hypothetical protein